MGELGVKLGFEFAKLGDGELGEIDCGLLAATCDAARAGFDFVRLGAVVVLVETPSSECKGDEARSILCWKCSELVKEGFGGVELWGTALVTSNVSARFLELQIFPIGAWTLLSNVTTMATKGLSGPKLGRHIKTQERRANKRFTQVKFYKVKTDGSVPDFHANDNANAPARFKRNFRDIPACTKWFLPDEATEYSSRKGWRYSPTNTKAMAPRLDVEYLKQFGEAMVALERTEPDQIGPPTFERFEAPLSLLFADMATTRKEEASRQTQLYLAQQSLADLPAGMQVDLPTPSILTKLGRGDIYASSLWMGRPPTLTPLHRDPNPNLFVQLAGKKIVRLFKPEVGQGMYERVKAALGQRSSNGHMRGEEMMGGKEREALDRAVWDEELGDSEAKGLQVELKKGDGLYIPLGWWHAVRSHGTSLNISVSIPPDVCERNTDVDVQANWWFR